MTPTIEIANWIDQQKISPIQVRVMLLSGGCALLEGFDAFNIAFVAPPIVHQWHLAVHAFTPVFMAGLAGLLIGCLVIAPLADKFGRKKVMLGSVIAFAIFSLISSLAWSITSLAVLRFLTGVGVGGGMANAIALTAEFFPERKRDSMTVVMFVGFPLGGALGGFLAAWLIPTYGWPSVFIAGGILPVALALGLAFGLPESIRHLVVNEANPERVIAILRRINRHAEFAPGTRFAIAEERRSGLTVGHLFREGRTLGTILIWIIFFTSLLAIFLVTSWLPVVLHEDGLSVSMAAVVGAVLNLCGVVGCIATGPLVERRGCMFVLLPAYVIAAIGIAAIGNVGHDIVPILVAAGVAGIGIVCGQDTANAYAASYYPTYIRATGVGWALGIGRIGAIVGPLIGGVMLAAHWTSSTLYAVSAIPELVAILAILGLMVLRRRRRAAGAAIA